MTGAVAFVAFGNNSSEDPASGLLEVDAVTATSVVASVPASSTAPSTAEPATSTIGPTDVAPGTYSFELASETPPSTAQRFRMSTVADGQTSVVEGAIDESQRMQMTMSMGEGMIAMDVVLDVVDGVGYYSGPAFDDMLTGDADWIGVNLEDAMADTGQSLEGLRENLSGAVSAARATWCDFDPVPMGLTEVEGESVMLYEVTLDGGQLSEAIAANPQFMPGGMQAEMASMIDGVVYGFYVTESNVVRRMTMSMELAGTGIETVYDFLPVEPGFQVTLPDPATVQLVDVDNLP